MPETCVYKHINIAMRTYIYRAAQRRLQTVIALF